MSIIITGLEMPKEGEWISVNISPDGKCFIQSWCGKDFNFAEKLTAVPVPPHGRLGDLDAVEAEIREKTNEQFCVNIVHAAPTIIEAEEG